MSDLQKFENSEQWRTKLRNFLLRENQPQVSKKGLNCTEDTNRYSFDVSEELKRLIDERKQKKMEKNSEDSTMKDAMSKFGLNPVKREAFDGTALESNVKDFCEDKENISLNHAVFKFGTDAVKKDVFDDSVLESEITEAHEISDESFEAMERMCNKSASDPDSTLFQYLHSNPKTGETKMTGAAADLFKAETDALNRLLYGTDGEKNINDESPLKGVEVTQIEDIEAPSRFWDNDTILQTSPVKMVGLLRPSTILECAELSDVSSAQASFKSATRDPLSEISSSCYETASDTMFSYKKCLADIKPDADASINLIELDKTLHVQDIKEEPFELGDHKVKCPIKVEKLIDLTLGTDFNNDSDDSDESSVIEILSDDEQLEQNQTVSLMKFDHEDSLNLNASKSQSVDEHDVLSTSSTDKEKSLHFNDTLEEVEYMMQKGLELMAGTGFASTQSPFKPNAVPLLNLPTKKQSTFIVSPAKQERASPKKEATNILGTDPHSAPKSESRFESRFAINFNPTPKKEFFKMPLSAKKSASKPVNRQKDKFAHVVSPIGTYIKKTAEAPLMSAAKTDNDLKNSSAFRELDFETRMHKPYFGNSKTELPKPLQPRSLPKKAYIASEYRQYTDERNAITIPESKVLKKYVDAAVLPSVIKHDGKANLVSGSSTATKLPIKTQKFGNSSSRENNSFANLSLVTGDVSLYTIKDAQKL